MFNLFLNCINPVKIGQKKAQNAYEAARAAGLERRSTSSTVTDSSRGEHQEDKNDGAVASKPIVIPEKERPYFYMDYPSERPLYDEEERVDHYRAANIAALILGRDKNPFVKLHQILASSGEDKWEILKHLPYKNQSNLESITNYLTVNWDLKNKFTALEDERRSNRIEEDEMQFHLEM